MQQLLWLVQHVNLNGKSGLDLNYPGILRSSCALIRSQLVQNLHKFKLVLCTQRKLNTICKKP